MRRSVFQTWAGLLLLAIASPTFADTRAVQSELKKQGFYFGDVDGSAGAEFGAAVKRYQIRNGLEVTGQVNDETLGALGIKEATSAPVAPNPAPPQARSAPQTPPRQLPPAATAPRVDLRKENAVRESDRRALREEPSSGTVPSAPIVRDRSVVPPPADYSRTPEPVDLRYRDLFAATPFASAPRVLQERTVRAAQAYLSHRGFYDGVVDGSPGPATEDAILDFQDEERLRSSGRLDLETLNAMRLLPGPQSENPALQRGFAAPGRPYERRTYRGIWVR